MSDLAPSTSLFQSIFQSTKRIGRGAICGEPQRQSLPTVSIHILDDESLLNVFFIYRPAIFDGDEDDKVRFRGGRGWNRERWWYKLVHVCQRWRRLILGSTIFLGLCLVCTTGTSIADMLAHSPPLPLVIDYDDRDCDITVEEEGKIPTLEQHDRVRRIRLHIPAPNLQDLIMVIDEEYPVLEYLIMEPSTGNRSTALMFPETLQAPHLRHLALTGFALPIRSRLLTTAVNLVTLALTVGHPSTYFRPNILLQWLSFMPQLETLVISFLFPVPNRDVAMQLMYTQNPTPIILPNLRWFVFRGVSAYMEAVVRRIISPRLEKFGLQFFKQLTFSVPHLLQLMNSAETPSFDSAEFKFSRNEVYVKVYPRDAAKVKMCPFSIHVDCRHLDWQVSSMAQIFNTLSQKFFTVEHLTLEYEVHRRASDEVDCTEWRKLLGSFSNAKTLSVDEGLVKELSCSLRPDDGKLPLELLPKLQKLTYSRSNNAGDGFASFIDARKNAGRPVATVVLSDRDYPVLLNNLLQGHPTGNLAPFLGYVMTQEGPIDNATHVVTANLRGVTYGVGRGKSRGAAKAAVARVVYEKFSTDGIPGA